MVKLPRFGTRGRGLSEINGQIHFALSETAAQI